MLCTKAVYRGEGRAGGKAGKRMMKWRQGALLELEITRRVEERRRIRDRGEKDSRL